MIEHIRNREVIRLWECTMIHKLWAPKFEIQKMHIEQPYVFNDAISNYRINKLRQRTKLLQEGLARRSYQESKVANHFIKQTY